MIQILEQNNVLKILKCSVQTSQKFRPKIVIFIIIISNVISCDDNHKWAERKIYAADQSINQTKVWFETTTSPNAQLQMS